ncbi:hypothetical protein GCM10007860_31000 [Chitiniphilus shinanonensis]|uniref:Uncharacterized protein n=1 Tax=Chitiniphilus shinanonensis TaxID=553088 RepID=A0ABQ6BZH8_9NEIS|nr:hypothetical protein GCM10007860_31000 [Chitiniphilus shinanonensis]
MSRREGDSGRRYGKKWGRNLPKLLKIQRPVRPDGIIALSVSFLGGTHKAIPSAKAEAHYQRQLASQAAEPA